MELHWIGRGEATRAAIALLALTTAACGGAASSSPAASETTVAAEPAHAVSARGDREVHARVGRAGGTLELGNGARLEIPEGALTEDVELVLHIGSPAREAWDDETKRALGPVIEIRPAIASSGGEFRISCPSEPIPSGFQPADLALGHEEDAGATHLGGATATRWQMWPARIEGGRFVAAMPTLAGHRLQFGVSR
jgi:hypothetical protein